MTGVMKLLDPVSAFEALAHQGRLAVLRLLIPAGRDGLPAGAIGEQVGIPPTALSFHLRRLTDAGLLCVRRVGRHQYYAVDYPQLGVLVRFLAEDCCADVPQGCMPGCHGAPSRPRETSGTKHASATVAEPAKEAT
jgi:ArsR family transcriptional regulator